MKTTIIAFVTALVAALTLSATPAHAEDSLYAFAEQPTSQSAGFIQINYAEGSLWTIEGQVVEVTPPASRFYYPAGIQAEVIGRLRASGTVETFWLQVNPSPSYTSAPSCDTSAQVAAEAKVTKLQAKVRELRNRLRTRR